MVWLQSTNKSEGIDLSRVANWTHQYLLCTLRVLIFRLVIGEITFSMSKKE
jgi:hypothetical protein